MSEDNKLELRNAALAKGEFCSDVTCGKCGSGKVVLDGPPRPIGGGKTEYCFWCLECDRHWPGVTYGEGHMIETFPDGSARGRVRALEKNIQTLCKKCKGDHDVCKGKCS